MALVNCSVFNSSFNSVVLSWEILSVGASGRTVEQFFRETISKELGSALNPEKLELSGVFLGKSKEHLDAVDLSVPLDMAVQSFGGFLRYHVSCCPEPQEPQRSCIDAFQLMMSSSRQQSARLLKKKEPPRNRKDELFNSIVNLLEEHKLSYSPAEAESCGQNLVRVLTDCLWHIDGHHDTLKDQSCPVPSIHWVQFARAFQAPKEKCMQFVI